MLCVLSPNMDDISSRKSVLSGRHTNAYIAVSSLLCWERRQIQAIKWSWRSVLTTPYPASANLRAAAFADLELPMIKATLCLSAIIVFIGGNQHQVDDSPKRASLRFFANTTENSFSVEWRR